jgi:hypothetical protein
LISEDRVLKRSYAKMERVLLMNSRNYLFKFDLNGGGKTPYAVLPIFLLMQQCCVNCYS